MEERSKYKLHYKREKRKVEIYGNERQIRLIVLFDLTISKLPFVAIVIWLMCSKQTQELITVLSHLLKLF